MTFRPHPLKEPSHGYWLATPCRLAVPDSGCTLTLHADILRWDRGDAMIATAESIAPEVQLVHRVLHPASLTNEDLVGTRSEVSNLTAAHQCELIRTSVAFQVLNLAEAVLPQSTLTDARLSNADPTDPNLARKCQLQGR